MKFLRHFWRWLFFPLVCLVTLIALIIAEENLRGKLAWERCKRALEAQGEHLDMAWFIPPPVPDDQNFAMFPPLKLLFTGWARVDSPTLAISEQLLERVHIVDGYDRKLVILFRKKGSWQTGNPSDLEAWQRYYRAAFPKLPLAGSAPEDVLSATDQIADIFAELREAVNTRPYTRFDIQYEKGVGAGLPHLTPLESLVRILSIRATAELRLNRPEDAYQDVQLAFHLIDATEDEPFLISGLVRIHQFSVLMGPIWEGIATHRWTDDQLLAFQTELQDTDWLADYCRGIRCELALGHDVIRRFSENPRLIMSMAGSSVSKTENAILACSKLLPGWMDQNLIYESREFQEIISCTDAKMQRVDVPRALREEERLQKEKRSPYNFLAKLFILQFTQPFQRFAMAQVWANEAIVACEIERYRLAHGRLPASLEELHMAAMPHDVINGEPLHYRVTDPDNYILYSVGWNGTDDGGQIAATENGSVDFTKGDWVWSLKPAAPQN
jgi:hypothetical protein